ncbi:MAG TPA: hypothetical protein PLB89_03350 [Flavobacteriales bacterium]|nr:hypothetical protein [Flavobacteriales bacterium]
MNTLNDALAQQVFKAMAVHRPQLAAIADLGDDEGDIDIRLLGDQIIRNFPWPIGIEVRRLLSGSMREPLVGATPSGAGTSRLKAWDSPKGLRLIR